MTFFAYSRTFSQLTVPSPVPLLETLIIGETLPISSPTKLFGDIASMFPWPLRPCPSTPKHTHPNIHTPKQTHKHAFLHTHTHAPIHLRAHTYMYIWIHTNIITDTQHTHTNKSI